MFEVQSPKKDVIGNQISNAVGYTMMVQNLVRDTDKDLQQYHKLVELFRQEISAMKSRIENNKDEIMETIQPLVQSLNRVLELGILNQKQENTNFQNQLTQLQKQKAIINQMIVATSKRTEELSQQVGFY